MKSDDHDKPNNAKSAMLDYYNEVLGSLVNDPLKERVQEERKAKVISSSIKVKQSRLAEGFVDKKLESAQAVLRKKKQAKKLPPTFYDDVYEEELKAEIVAPLIISAAFPKMAPKKLLVPIATSAELTTPEKTVLAEVMIEAKKVNEVENKKSLPKQILPSKSRAKPIVNKVKPVKITVSEAAHTPVLDSNTDFQKKSILVSPDHRMTGRSSLDSLPDNGRPVWAQERFECLLFSVAGLQLAVPLVSLGAIYKIESNFTPLVGRASWFMGLYRHDERNVRVVDTAQLVMPDRVVSTTREKYRYIIRLGGNNWGMACDSVQEAIQLEPEEVKWRTEQSKRAWLSGTVIEHMCALIDVNALGDILKKEALSKHSAFNA